jgi:integrase
MRRFPLGAYPETGISKAREAARTLHVRVLQDGADPVRERRAKRAMGADAKAGIGTLAAVLDIYTAKQGNTLKSWPDGRKRVELVFKALLQRPIAALTAADFQLEADRHPHPHGAAFAVRTLRPALRWAAKRGYLAEAATHLHSPAPTTRRQRVLSRDELAALLPELSTSSRPYAACARFLLLTLARREEATAAVWRDVDFQAATWTIRETKNGQPHVVPLSAQAVALLQTRLPKDGAGKVLKPAPTARVFATGTGGPLRNWDRETKVLMEASKTGGWTRHDLRRTGATMLGEMGELPDIIEAALNHVAIRSPLAATYNRSRYRPQVAAALQRLADALDGIEAGAAEVVQLHRTKAA